MDGSMLAIRFMVSTLSMSNTATPPARGWDDLAGVTRFVKTTFV